MRRALVLAILVLLAFTQLSNAADLQAGWYAGLQGPYVYCDDGSGQPYLRASGWFTTPSGAYGPFSVEGEAYGNWRRLTVTNDVTGIGPDQSLLLPLGFGMTTGEQILYMTFSWRTIYDAEQMRVELWRQRYSGTDELVWGQYISGDESGYLELARNTVMEGNYYYKIAVVPEPNSLAALVIMTTLVLSSKCRRTVK